MDVPAVGGKLAPSYGDDQAVGTRWNGHVELQEIGIANKTG